MKHCHICKRLIDDPNDPEMSADCGGDCQACMFVLEHLDFAQPWPSDDEVRPIMIEFYKVIEGWEYQFTPPQMSLDEIKQWTQDNK